MEGTPQQKNPESLSEQRRIKSIELDNIEAHLLDIEKKIQQLELEPNEHNRKRQEFILMEAKEGWETNKEFVISELTELDMGIHEQRRVMFGAQKPLDS
jgi:hypothetical protein